MEKEFVAEKGWIKKERFEEALVFCKMLPGPTSFQMALWIGSTLFGRLGGLLAGLSFIGPTSILLALFAKHYDKLVAISSFREVLNGLQAGALVIICQSLVHLIWPYRYQTSTWGYVVISFCLMQIAPRAEPLIILIGGVLALTLRNSVRSAWALRMPSGALILSIFWVHLKAGALVFGPGLTILSVLQKDVVEKFQWLSRGEFMDAFSLTQSIPGPVTTLSSFIGFQIGGSIGSVAALVGIYLPSVLFILFLLPVIKSWIEGRTWFRTFYQGAFFAVLGCLGASSLQLFSSTLTSVQHQIAFCVLMATQLIFSTPLWVTLLSGSAIEWFIK